MAHERGIHGKEWFFVTVFWNRTGLAPSHAHECVLDELVGIHALCGIGRGV